LDRLQLTVWTKANPKSVSVSDEPIADQIVAVENRPEKAPISSGYTLRVKPDRRCTQVPVPAELDRRRPR
jgi:antitoxin (DNA-binding transcriptional repressor) of toxin-antitoxin stability system